MTTTFSLGQIVIDSADAAELAGFWSRLLDRPLIDGANQFFAVIPPAADGSLPGPDVPRRARAAHRARTGCTWTWSAPTGRRGGAGGRPRRDQIGDFDEYGTQWTTLADPEGNVFDIGLPHCRPAPQGRPHPSGAPSFPRGQGWPRTLPDAPLNRPFGPRRPATPPG